jgi:UTP--glucose-1-phosphate uridylyltransferase
LLPVLNRPVIDYVVQDCIRAGIKHIVLVVSEQNKEQLQRYFGRNEDLENYLVTHGKEEMLPLVHPPEDVEFEYVVQPADVPYGTVTPIALARPSIPKGEQALILMGDDFFYTGDDRNAIADLLEATGDGASALAAQVDHSQVYRYGVLVADDEGNLQYSLEKPKPEESPSNMISTAKSVFTSDLLDETVAFYNEPSTPGKEKYFNLQPYERYMAKGNKIKVVQGTGTYLDTGTLDNWLKANVFIAKAQGIDFTV